MSSHTYEAIWLALFVLCLIPWIALTSRDREFLASWVAILVAFTYGFLLLTDHIKEGKALIDNITTGLAGLALLAGFGGMSLALNDWAKSKGKALHESHVKRFYRWLFNYKPETSGSQADTGQTESSGSTATQQSTPR